MIAFITISFFITVFIIYIMAFCKISYLQELEAEKQYKELLGKKGQ